MQSSRAMMVRWSPKPRLSVKARAAYCALGATADKQGQARCAWTNCDEACRLFAPDRQTGSLNPSPSIPLAYGGRLG